MRINLYSTLDRSDRAVEVALDYLRLVDARWPQHARAEDVQEEYDRLRQRLWSGSIEGLLDLPPMADLDRCATMDVLTVLTSPALFTDLNLFRLVVGLMATLSLEPATPTDRPLPVHGWAASSERTSAMIRQGTASVGLAWIWSRSAALIGSGPVSNWSSQSMSRTGHSPWLRAAPFCGAPLRPRRKPVTFLMPLTAALT